MSAKLRTVFEAARREGWALGAFNVSNLEEVKAVLQAAKTLEAPVIIEASPGESGYFGIHTLRAAVTEHRSTLGVQAWLNLDHAVEEGAVQAAIKAEFDAVHYDGSLEERSANIAGLRRVVPVAHRHGILVEGEPDHITGSSTTHTKGLEALQDAATYSDPDAFEAFVRESGVDTAAVFIGNVHGLYDAPKRLDLERLKRLRERVACFLSLHGGSGIPDADVRAAIKHGVTKVNVNSELRQAFLAGLQAATKHPEELAPYKYLPEAVEAVQRVVERKIKLFGSVGKATSRWVHRSLS